MAHLGRYADSSQEIRAFAVDSYLRVIESANEAGSKNGEAPWIPTADGVTEFAETISQFVTDGTRRS